jgi:hypothetical protein
MILLQKVKELVQCNKLFTTIDNVNLDALVKSVLRVFNGNARDLR